ncbi:LuxR family transcriptional regulator [soil metagenome]
MSETVAPPVLNEHWPFVGRRAELEGAVHALGAPGAAGVAVHGPAGVGRSRFAAELLGELADPSGPTTGHRVVRVVANESVGSVPLGALAHLLPAETLLADDAELAIDPIRVLSQAREALTSEGDLVLAIDDAHLLDAVSLTLLHQLLGAESVRLIVTVRSGEPEPDALSSLWRSGTMTRIDLTPLSSDSVDTLLHLGLAGPVDGRAARLLNEASAGSPLLLREVVRTATEEGTLTQIDGVWRLNGSLPVARRAVELVAGRLASLDEASRGVLELLVLVGETPLDLIDESDDPHLLERLESEGLIVVRAGACPGDGHTVAISRHVVVDAVRAELSPLRSRNILRRHADLYAAIGTGSPEDELRIAGWRLDAGLPGDAVTLEQAATLARHAEDFEATIRFAEAADRSGGTLRSGVLWGDALYELSRWQQCEEVFASAAERPGNAFDRLRLVSSRTTNLLFGLMRGEDALAMTLAALADLDAGAPEWREGIEESMVAGVRRDLVSRVALLQMYSGDPASAVVTLGDPPPPVPPGDDSDLDVRDALRSRALWAIPSVPAIALSGRTGAAVALGFQAFEEHSRLGGEVGFSPVGIHLVTLSLALQEHGDLDQARALATAGYEETLQTGTLLGQIWFGLNLGRIGLLTGHPETARRWTREVLAATGASSWLGPRQMALSGMAAASALVGDLETARRSLAEADTIGPGFDFLFPERVLGRAWLAAAEGHLDEARTTLTDSAALARDSGHLTAESWLRYEAVRLGAGSSETARLRELAESSDSAFLEVRARYAEAMAVDDPAELELVGDQLEALECDLAASELFNAAAEVMRTRGLPRAATALALRATNAIARSEGARSHRLNRIDSIVPLTAREREIAGLAASGVPSKEIAERLFLSVRTVNNHRQNADTKLGVSSRAELARVLAEGA